MKYLFYAIVFDVAGNTTAVGSSSSPAKAITTNIQNVTGISINPSGAQTKNIGENFKITATVSPSDANNKTINWSSSSTSVATVDSSGNVRCLTAGTTTITATAADGSSISASLTLTVRNPINSLTLDKDQTTLLYGGATTTVAATTNPSDYDASNITWTIGDTSLATISGSGKSRTITSNNTKKTGETTLTVTAGNITKTVTINIVETITFACNAGSKANVTTGTLQSWEIPYTGKFKFEIVGASASGHGYSGNSTMKNEGGLGAKLVATFSLNKGDVIDILIGAKGEISDNNHGTGDTSAGGGGGGTWLFKHINSITDTRYEFTKGNQKYQCLAVAAGGCSPGDYGRTLYALSAQSAYGGMASDYASPSKYIAYSTSLKVGTDSNNVNSISDFIENDLIGTTGGFGGVNGYGGYGGGSCGEDDGRGGGWANHPTKTHNSQSGTYNSVTSWCLDTTAIGTDGYNHGNGYLKISSTK